MCKSWNLQASHPTAVQRMRGGGQACSAQGVKCFWRGLCSFCAPWNPTAAPGKASPYPERCLCWAHAEQTCRWAPPACPCPPIAASSDVKPAIVCLSLLPLNICSSVPSTAWQSIILVLGFLWLSEHQESQASVCSLSVSLTPTGSSHTIRTANPGQFWLFSALWRNRLTWSLWALWFMWRIATAVSQERNIQSFEQISIKISIFVLWHLFHETLTSFSADCFSILS